MDELMEPFYLQHSSWMKRPHLQTVPLLVTFLLCIVTTTWGDDLNNVGGDIAEKVLNEVLGDDDVKLVDTDNKSYGDGVPCWKTETFTTQGPCLACDKIAMQYASYCCGETGFRQLVQCQASNFRIYKSCPKTKWALEKSFWTFEGIILAIWIVSFLVVSLRRRFLDWEALQRVRKQIANSV
ncbi:protein JTB-like [Asterias amurensis]|uniref:protein JTB-like n=1 Tax=Asterias amurensis TaxID=7602 RepID=UPI003AB53E8C